MFHVFLIDVSENTTLVMSSTMYYKDMIIFEYNKDRDEKVVGGRWSKKIKKPFE